MGLHDDGFDNPYDRAMAKQSEQFRFSHVRIPEPPPPRCRECDELIPEDEYAGPDTPTECEDCCDS